MQRKKPGHLNTKNGPYQPIKLRDINMTSVCPTRKHARADSSLCIPTFHCLPLFALFCLYPSTCKMKSFGIGKKDSTKDSKESKSSIKIGTTSFKTPSLKTPSLKVPSLKTPSLSTSSLFSKDNSSSSDLPPSSSLEKSDAQSETATDLISETSPAVGETDANDDSKNEPPAVISSAISDTLGFYGSLLGSTGQPSSLFRRICDSLFTFVDQHCDVEGLRNTGFIEPKKYVWMRVEVGADPDELISTTVFMQAYLMQAVLKSYYDFARIPYRLTMDGDAEVAMLSTVGCLHLHIFQALLDPDEAYEDWTKYFEKFVLIDPETSLPFPGPFPRSCLPDKGIPALRTAFNVFKRQALARMENARQINEVRKKLTKAFAKNANAALNKFQSALSRSSSFSPSDSQLTSPDYSSPKSTSSGFGWGKRSIGLSGLGSFKSLSVSSRSGGIDVTNIEVGCRCFGHQEDAVHTLVDVEFLKGLVERNPNVQAVRTRLRTFVEQRWSTLRQRARDAGVALLQPREADDVFSDVAESLNTLMRTNYTLEKPGLQQHLQKCIDNAYDFGAAYGRLRPYWFDNFEELEGKLKVAEAEDWEMRNDALDETKTRIINPKVPPRRVWDLYSNRVLPWWIPAPWKELPWALSHSWVEFGEREFIMTDINENEWPVPIPNDVNLERVRIELLNYGAEYVWLDVLCLRQDYPTDPKRHALMLEEQNLDVPIIGNVYRDNPHIFIYFNGLGRPFRISEVKGARSWLNRAWTLQEASRNAFIGGIESAETQLGFDLRGHFENALIRMFYITLELHSRHALRKIDNESIYPVLECMRNRGATYEKDKIAGLAYLLRCKVLPAYNGDDPEDAWDRLLGTIAPSYRADLLFLYPEAGDASITWRPSWNQIKEKPLPPVDKVKLYEEVSYSMSTKTCSYVGFVLKDCTLEGFTGYRVYCPKGQLRFIRDDKKYAFSVIAHHQQDIPDGSYVLVGNKGGPLGTRWDPSHMYWVVAQDAGEGKLKKVSVVKMESEEDRKELQRVGHAKEENVTFV
ncbi:hypothetical protein NM688_g3524 [Phlebia brevispora]|uniref:Uncharacterized protein n=1 Tax=Phlebia brevispora TaxID=194682 RepID=A0ACC1T5L0_9APHY|nr:hypothetical protein NM688_g3524 [Phlebia brevispora]